MREGYPGNFMLIIDSGTAHVYQVRFIYVFYGESETAHVPDTIEFRTQSKSSFMREALRFAVLPSASAAERECSNVDRLLWNASTKRSSISHFFSNR